MTYFCVPSRLGDRRPLEARRVAGAASAAETALGDHLADLGGGHVGEDRPEGLVAASLEVVVEALGVDAAHVLRRHPKLLLEERTLRLGCVRVRDHLERLDDRGDRIGRDRAEQLSRLRDLDQRPRCAQAETADPLDDDVRQAGLGGRLAEAQRDVVGLAGDTGGGLAHVRVRADGSLVDLLGDHAAADRPRRGWLLAHIASSWATRSPALTLPLASPSTTTAGARLQAPRTAGGQQRDLAVGGRLLGPEAELPLEAGQDVLRPVDVAGRAGAHDAGVLALRLEGEERVEGRHPVHPRVRDAERIADVVQRDLIEEAERLLRRVERLDQRGRTIAHAAHPRLDDLPALVVARRRRLGVQSGHPHPPWCAGATWRRRRQRGRSQVPGCGETRTRPAANRLPEGAPWGTRPGVPTGRVPARMPVCRPGRSRGPNGLPRPPARWSPQGLATRRRQEPRDATPQRARRGLRRWRPRQESNLRPTA